MTHSGAAISELRRVLADKFPTVAPRPSGILHTGLSSLDSEGGLSRGAMTELVCSLGCGGLFVEAMIAALVAERCFGALVDAGNAFDAQDNDGLSRLLWVRCSSPMQAVKAADLIVRDGNLQLVLLDLQAAPLHELRRMPASTWHRFQRIVEPTGTALVVLTCQPVVEGAKVRVATHQRWTVAAMRERRRALWERMTMQVFARRQFSVALEPKSA